MSDSTPPSASQCKLTWTERLKELRACPWYWGDLSWKDAEKLLVECPSGTYLIRDSRNDAHVFSVSYNADGRVLHSRVGLSGASSRLGGPPHSQESVIQMLEKAVKASLCGDANLLMHRKGDAAHAETLDLREPLSRIDLLPPLAYLCRLKLRSSFNLSELQQQEGISPKVMNYIYDPKYIVPPITYCIDAIRKRYSHVEEMKA